MKRILIIMLALALTPILWMGAGVSFAQNGDSIDDIIAKVLAARLQQDSIDKSDYVLVYDYECLSQDADGKAVTDRMQVAVQVGKHCTRSYPYRKFREDTESFDYYTPENFHLLKAESYCFMPEVWTNYPDGKTTVRDAVVPNIYETREALKPINWTLSTDTVTIGRYHCKTAVCLLHGRQWTVRYTSDIPTSAGPWKLCGLPGVIVDAESEGVHRFTLTALHRKATPVYYEHNAITKMTDEQNLIKMRKKIFGNRLYPYDPQYYLPDFGTADVTYCWDNTVLVNNVLVQEHAHVYQPLEQE